MSSPAIKLLKTVSRSPSEFMLIGKAEASMLNP